MGEEKYILYADLSNTDIVTSDFKSLDGKRVGVLMGTEPEIMLTEWENKNGIQTEHVNVYNNDGPGFCEDVIQTEEYQEIMPKTHTYIPQSSIIGRLMNHKEEYTIVESTQKGIMQHDLYTWQILGKEFVTAKELTNDSVFIDKTITSWLEKVEPTKREQVIDVIFEILSNTDAQTMKELKANWFVNARTILTSYKNIDNETKELVWQTLNELFKATKDNLNQWGR